MSRFILAIVLVGQLHTTVYGLKDVRKDEVRVGTLEAVKPAADAKTKDREATIAFEGGKTERVMLYGGVVWTDARKSPIDRRLRGATIPAPGTRVIVVGGGRAELLVADAANLRKVELLFDDAARAKWLASDAAVLRADRDDPDLGDLARAELTKRGALTLEDQLLGDQRLLFQHFDGLSPADKRKFLDAALPIARTHEVARERMFDLLRNAPTAETIGALAPLIALSPPTDERKMSDARVALLNAIHRGPVDLSPFADFLVVLNANRPRHYSTDSDLVKITDRLDAPAKQKVAIGFLAHATSSTQLYDGIDLFLVESAVRLAREAPSAELLAPLEQWNLSKIDGAGRGFAIAGIVDVAAAVGSFDRARARALVEPLLAGKQAIPAEAVARYRAVVPPVVGAPEPFRIKSLGLSTRMLQPGAEVRFDASRDGTATLTLNFGKGDRRQDFAIDGDWTREWIVDGWKLTAKRAGGGRYLTLSAIPP